MSAEPPQERSGAASPVPAQDVRSNTGPPFYDTDREDGYAGISVAGLESLEDVHASREFAEMIVDFIREGLLILDFELCVKAANESFFEQFEVGPEDTIGRLVYELGNNQWDIPELRRLLEDVLPKNKAFDNYEVEHEFEGIGSRSMLLNARQLNDHRLILLAIDDVTERKEAVRSLREREQAQRQLAESLEERVEERTQQVRKLALAVTRAEQEERRRISQLLHDDLQQLLYGLQMKLKLARDSTGADTDEPIRKALRDAEKLVWQGIDVTRNLTVDLSPPILAGEGLTDMLDWLTSRMEQLHDLRVEITADQPFRTQDHAVRVLLYRIIRELLFNVAKHSGTNEATVHLSDVDHRVRIVVADEGKGFDVEDAEAQSHEQESFGLFSVRERLGLFGGSMDIDSEPGRGTRITIDVPLELE